MRWAACLATNKRMRHAREPRRGLRCMPCGHLLQSRHTLWRLCLPQNPTGRRCRSPHRPAGCSLACSVCCDIRVWGFHPKPRQGFHPCPLTRAMPWTYLFGQAEPPQLVAALGKAAEGAARFWREGNGRPRPRRACPQRPGQHPTRWHRQNGLPCVRALPPRLCPRRGYGMITTPGRCAHGRAGPPEGGCLCPKLLLRCALARPSAPGCSGGCWG